MGMQDGPTTVYQECLIQEEIPVLKGIWKKRRPAWRQSWRRCQGREEPRTAGG